MLWTAFILGLLGSFHCVGMCGPIAFLLPLDRKNKSKRILQVISYHVGRLTTYALIGLVFGLIGKSLYLFGAQQQLSIIIGVIMVLSVIIPSKWINQFGITKVIYRAVTKLKNTLGEALKKKNSGMFFILGFLNGLLPCGLVYMAVFGALALGNLNHGIGYMVLFGVGTIPLMTTAIYLGNFLKGKAKQRILKAIPAFVVIVGLLFILRGMGLGIKYISPSEMVSTEKVDADSSCH